MILSEYDALQDYNQMLDDVYPEVTLGFSSFLPSRVLKEMDPIAYRVGFREYVNGLVDDGTFVEGYTDDLEEGVDEGLEESFDDSMDGDHDSAMASAGFGTDESYFHDSGEY